MLIFLQTLLSPECLSYKYILILEGGRGPRNRACPAQSRVNRVILKFLM